MVLARTFLSGIASGYRVVRPTTVRRYSLPFFVLGRGPLQSMIIIENDSEGTGMGFKRAWGIISFGFPPSGTQDTIWGSLISVYESLARIKRCSMTLALVSFMPRWPDVPSGANFITSSLMDSADNTVWWVSAEIWNGDKCVGQYHRDINIYISVVSILSSTRHLGSKVGNFTNFVFCHWMSYHSKGGVRLLYLF